MTKSAAQKGRAAIEKRANALSILKIEYVAITAVTPNSYNPNRQSEHDFDLLKRSITEDGFTQPIIVQAVADEQGRHPIVDGEHRWRAARELGYTEVPVVKTDMTAEQMKIATLRHNRARGSEDMELSAQLLRELTALGAGEWAQDSLMLSDAEMNRLMEEVPAPEALAEEEFGEAWNPIKKDDGMGGAAAGEDGAVTQVVASPEASDRLRAQEKRMAEAKTEEERAQAKKDANIFRLTLIFANDEADLVRALLGEAPAVKLLDMARAAASVT